MWFICRPILQTFTSNHPHSVVRLVSTLGGHLNVDSSFIMLHSSFDFSLSSFRILKFSSQVGTTGSYFTMIIKRKGKVGTIFILSQSLSMNRFLIRAFSILMAIFVTRIRFSSRSMFHPYCESQWPRLSSDLSNVLHLIRQPFSSFLFAPLVLGERGRTLSQSDCIKGGGRIVYCLSQITLAIEILMSCSCDQKKAKRTENGTT